MEPTVSSGGSFGFVNPFLVNGAKAMGHETLGTGAKIISNIAHKSSDNNFIIIISNVVTNLQRVWLVNYDGKLEKARHYLRHLYIKRRIKWL
jgi:hypothetical protein